MLESEKKLSHYYPQLVAEFIGTFFLVFFGCGSMILAQLDPNFNGTLIPFAFGGAVSIMIYSVGHLSGAHFNPAVTLAFWSARRFPAYKLIGYIISQMAGASLASFVHKIIWGNQHDFGLTTLSQGIGAGFLVEFILSFILMFVIISVATDSRARGELAGIAIGTTVALCAFVGGPLTKASMNPARSFGPALMAGEYKNLWLYIVAPILGTLIGAFVYEKIRCDKK